MPPPQALWFHAFHSRPGVGGHCLPIDPSYLSWHMRTSVGRSFRFVELANDVNDHMPDYVVGRANLALNRRQRALNGSRSSCWAWPTNATPRTCGVSLAPGGAAPGLLGAQVAYVDDHVPHSRARV